MRRGNGDARSSSSGPDMNHHHHLGLGVIGGGRGVGPGKGCATPQCSWRLLAIALLLTCGLLAAALAYFTGKSIITNSYVLVKLVYTYSWSQLTIVSSIGASTVSDPNCILIEDAQVTLPREDNNNNNKMPVKGTWNLFSFFFVVFRNDFIKYGTPFYRIGTASDSFQLCCE